MKIIITILVLYTLFPFVLHSTSTDNLQYPPGIKWSMIDTEHFKIVFPVNLKKKAAETVIYIEKIFPSISFSRDNRSEKFTIFLNNFGILSNGFVQLAPKMGEFSLTPPQSMFLGNSDWIKGLAVHEGRHTIQFSYLNRGFTKFSGLLFGEIGRSLFSFLSVPQWFWEGDAVREETILSKGGRGRVAAFNVGLRTILLRNKRYIYAKAYLSSYKDYVPDIYKLGYFMSTYVWNTYPDDVWEKVLKHSSKYSFYPFIFSSSLKKVTGKNVKTIYKESMDDIYRFWKRDFDLIKPTPFKILNPLKKEWTYYSSPVSLKSGNIIAQKFSLSNPLSLVRIGNNRIEKVLLQINPVGSTQNILSVNRSEAVWSERKTDPRWGKREYSEIVIYNMKNRNFRRISKKTRFFSPSFSPDGKKVSVVNLSKEGKSELVILDSKNGIIINRFSQKNPSFIATPAWSEDGQKIVMIEERYGEKRIVLLNLKDGNFSAVIPYCYENFKYPAFFKGNIIYGSDISGIDNIYSVNIKSKKKFKITSALFGASFPFVDKIRQKLIYCDYDINGTNIVSVCLDPESWIPLKQNNRNRKFYFDHPGNKTGELKLIPHDKNIQSVKVKKYNRLKDLINFHSRIIDPEAPEPGLIFLSDNKLNTLSLQAGLKYNTNERGTILFFSGTYAGLFPKINFAVSTRRRSSGGPDYYKWDENELKLGVEIPLNLSSGTHLRNLSLGTDISFMNILDKNSEHLIEDGILSSVTFELKYSSFKISSKRDIIPKAGHYFTSMIRKTPFGGFYNGYLLSFYGGIIFPCISKNHQLLLKGGYEYQNPVNYLFSSQIPFPRGYTYSFHSYFSMISSDYIFPIVYPDLDLGNFVYIKRVRGDIFADIGRGYGNNTNRLYRSAGLELKLDFNMFLIPTEIYGGCRITYRFDKKSFSIEPLFFEIGF